MILFKLGRGGSNQQQGTIDLSLKLRHWELDHLFSFRKDSFTMSQISFLLAIIYLTDILQEKKGKT